MRNFSLASGLAAGSMAAATLLGGCGLLEPKAERYAAPPVGMTYARDIRSTGSYGNSYREDSRYVGERTWQGRTLLAHERSNGQVTMVDTNGGWVGQFKDGSPLFTFDPPLSVGYPIHVGKTTSKDIRMTLHAQNRVVPFSATWKVEAYEDVQVPAGTFKAFRIAYQDTNGVTSVTWVSPEDGLFVKFNNSRSAKHPAGPGTQEGELVSLGAKR